jgi:hypothetical protein
MHRAETTRTVAVRAGASRQTATLNGQDIVAIDIPFHDLAGNEPVEFFVEGETCRIDGDNREFTLQVFQPQFTASE